MSQNLRIWKRETFSSQSGPYFAIRRKPKVYKMSDWIRGIQCIASERERHLSDNLAGAERVAIIVAFDVRYKLALVGRLAQ